MENETIVMQYISVWGWHLTSLLFLIASLISIMEDVLAINTIFFIVFLAGFAICEFIANKRKLKLKLDVGNDDIFEGVRENSEELKEEEEVNEQER